MYKNILLILFLMISVSVQAASYGLSTTSMSATDEQTATESFTVIESATGDDMEISVFLIAGGSGELTFTATMYGQDDINEHGGEYAIYDGSTQISISHRSCYTNMPAGTFHQMRSITTVCYVNIPALTAKTYTVRWKKPNEYTVFHVKNRTFTLKLNL